MFGSKIRFYRIKPKSYFYAVENLILIFICLTAGILLKTAKILPPKTHLGLNAFIIYISLPAVALYHIPKIELSSQLLLPISVAWLCFGISFLLFRLLGKKLGWSNKLIGCITLTAGLGNTSFIGFPIIEAAYGPEAVPIGLILDQMGSFLVLSTLGIATAGYYSKGKADIGSIARKVLLFPPFIAFVLAFLIQFTGWDFPAEVQPVFLKLGATITPLAMVSVGLQLSIDIKSRHWPFLGMGLAYKLILFPLLLTLPLWIFVNEWTLIQKTSVLEAAMAPMITAAIVASAHGLKPKLSSMMLGIGIPVSFLSLWVWYLILENM